MTARVIGAAVVLLAADLASRRWILADPSMPFGSDPILQWFSFFGGKEEEQPLDAASNSTAESTDAIYSLSHQLFGGR